MTHKIQPITHNTHHPTQAASETVPNYSSHTHPLRMIVLIVGFIGLVLYGTIVFTTGDFFWFLKQFDAHPASIVVYHEKGKRTELHPGQPGFDELASAIQTCLSEGLERPSGIGFSDASLLDAYTRYITVEAFFERPVQLHAWFDTKPATQMLFPVTGRHSEMSLVLLGTNGKYLASPPVLKTIEPLRETLKALGYY
jgi:hypothetical protein